MLVRFTELTMLLCCLGIFVVGSCDALAQSLQLEAQEADFLDLASPKAPQQKRTEKGSVVTRQEKDSNHGLILFDGHPLQQISPLKVTLQSLNARSYRLGEQVIFEVTLENITKEALVIPWSGDEDAVKPNREQESPGYVSAFLSLVMKDGAADSHLVVQGLYGSQLVPSSLKSLLPGQKVRIMVAGHMDLFSEDTLNRVLATLPRAIEIRAEYSLHDRLFAPHYEPVTSVNSQTIELKKQQETSEKSLLK